METTGVESSFFAYGTLMCEDILERVVGSILSGQRAELEGYRCRRVEGEVYPGIVAAEGERVEGIVYSGVGAEAWRRLDAFEGRLYERAAVAVRLGTGEMVSGQTYVIRCEYRYRLTDEVWGLEPFLENGKRRFETGYFGFDAITMEADQ